MGGKNFKRPTAMKGPKKHVKTSVSTEILTGAK
jgi:hypothetical protein